MKSSLPCSFHDFYLTAVSVRPRNTRVCDLTLEDRSGCVLRVSLGDVECLKLDNFLEGNIVCELTVKTGRQVSAEEILLALGIDDAPIHWEYIERILKRFQEQTLHLVEIAPSYGASLSCICATITAEGTADGARPTQDCD